MGEKRRVKPQMAQISQRRKRLGEGVGVEGARVGVGAYGVGADFGEMPMANCDCASER
jgi:hypothetical protein